MDGENDEKAKLKRLVQMKKVFSTDSATSFNYQSYFKATEPKNYGYRICNRDLTFKLIQLATEIISAGLYSRGLLVMPFTENPSNGTSTVSDNITNITNIMFPNVVFSSFIIVTSVVAMSYVLGQEIPDVITRIFNTIALILHLVSACITTSVWAATEKTSANGAECDMLIAQVFTTMISVFLYGLDIFLALKKAVRFDEVVENAEVGTVP